MWMLNLQQRGCRIALHHHQQVQEETHCAIDIQGELRLRSGPHQPALKPGQSLLMLTFLPARLIALKHLLMTLGTLI